MKNGAVWAKFLARMVNLARSELDLASFEVLNCGENTRVGRGCQMNGRHGIFIGGNCVIGEHSWFNVNSYDASTSRIDVGDFSLIGRRNFVSSGRSIRLGPYTLTGPDCHLVCSDHNISDAAIPYIAGQSSLDGAISLGANCWLGTSVIVLGTVNIGRGSVVGSGSVVLKDLPPFSLAVGHPARVIKRYDFRRKTWIAADQWSPELESTLPSEEEYLAMLKVSAPRLSIPKLAAGAGVDRPSF